MTTVSISEEINTAASPETALWRAVLLRALQDACGCHGQGGDKNYRVSLQSEARTFLRIGNAHFRDICHAADIDPE